jgi:hypothetical protein
MMEVFQLQVILICLLILLDKKEKLLFSKQEKLLMLERQQQILWNQLKKI